MITLYLLRHAHAGSPQRWTGEDAVRPLSEKGRRQADSLGRLLAGSDDAPDLFITSPRLRAEETARIVGQAIGAPIVVDERVAGPLDAGVVEAILADTGQAERPCLVGHDPDFSDLLGELIGLSSVPMRKGAFARVDLPGRPVTAGHGVLRLLVPPEILPNR